MLLDEIPRLPGTPLSHAANIACVLSHHALQHNGKLVSQNSSNTITSNVYCSNEGNTQSRLDPTGQADDLHLIQMSEVIYSQFSSLAN